MDLHLIIHGRVQGVGYREWLRRRACDVGLAGWVRNRAEGTVEALLSGPPDAVEAVAAAAMHGPAGANVRDIERRGEGSPRPAGAGADFVILPSV